MTVAEPQLNTVFDNLGTTIFQVMSDIAVENEAINLGQGFPDVDGPAEILEEAARVVRNGPNQYPMMTGVPELRQAVADHDLRFYGLEYDWKSEVVVTSGATEALADCFMALLNPGDEAILVEPFYDCYLPMLRRCGADVKVLSLKPPQWSFTREDLEAVFSDRTKLICLNTPMNPAGKVFERAELKMIAEFLERHDAYAVCDEVYEHLTFGGCRHLPLACVDGMRDRALRIGSAGKTFSLTGWKVGYISGPARLMSAVAKAHQFVTFTTPPALQYAVALGLNQSGDYYDSLAGELEAKRDLLSGTLERIGLPVLPCDGTYFLTADVARFGFNGSDLDFCKHIAVNAKVAAVPMSAFYHPDTKDVPNSLVRFCFCKRDEVMEEAAARLERFLGAA